MNWKMNKAMQQHITVKRKKAQLIEVDIVKLKHLLLPHFRRLGDGIVISEEEISLTEETIIDLGGTKSGYEYMINEICVSDSLMDNGSLSDIIKLAFLVVDIWAINIKLFDPEMYCYYIYCDNLSATYIRFHKFRKSEGMWLDENIDSYKEPTAYVIR